MIMTSLARTFHAAFEEQQRVLDEAHLRGAEERARLAELGAGRRDRVVARLVGAVLALVHDDEVDGPAELQRAVDRGRRRGGEYGTDSKKALYGGALAGLACSAAAAGRPPSGSPPA